MTGAIGLAIRAMVKAIVAFWMLYLLYGIHTNVESIKTNSLINIEGP